MKATLFSLIALVAPLIGAGSYAADGDIHAPQAVIQTTASELQEELSGRADYFADNPQELYDVIGRVLLPSFDTEYLGKQVLGRTHWTAATEDQRGRFIDAFYSFLVKTYAKGILDFNQDRMRVLPEVSYSKDKGKALVRTELAMDGGDDVQINYALRETPEGWRIYDVRIDGVSYIQNYRSQFDAEISAEGIDSVIQRLEAEAAAAEAKASATDT